MLPGGRVRGLSHIHSTFSYDGQVSLKDIAQRARGEGYAFLLISEHAETLLEQNSSQGFFNTCRQLSREDFLVIPGVEYDCSKNLHIMLLGIRELPVISDPLELVGRSRKNGSLSVLAHYDFGCAQHHQEVLACVEGLEIWNKKYDGRFAFDPKKGYVFNQLRKINPSLKMFCGLDFHSWVDWAPLYLEVKVEALSQDKLLSALARGDFFLSNGKLLLEANRFEIPGDRKLRFVFQSKGSILVNRVKKEARRLANFLRVPVPKRLREKLRRFP